MSFQFRNRCGHSSRSTRRRTFHHRAIYPSTTTTYDHETIRRGEGGRDAGFALTRGFVSLRRRLVLVTSLLPPPLFIFSFYYSPLSDRVLSLSLSSYSPLPSFNLYFLLPRILGIIQRAHVPHWGCTHVADYLRRQRRRATTRNDAVARNPR